MYKVIDCGKNLVFGTLSFRLKLKQIMVSQGVRNLTKTPISQERVIDKLFWQT